MCFLPGSGSLRPIETDLAVASAQVKSAIIFAASLRTSATVPNGSVCWVEMPP